MAAYATIILIIITCFISWKGLENDAFLDGYCFKVAPVLGKDYIRLVSSGFVHLSWLHLIFNMLALYMFGSMLEFALGIGNFLLIYFASLVGGSLLALFIHRHHPDYSSAGASGAVAGLIFATIALFPGMSMGMFFLPLNIPAWIYGLLYVIYSIYGIRSKLQNVGHEAHLGGALIGMLVAIAIRPLSLSENYFAILVILVPGIAFIYIIITRPHVLLIDNLFYKGHHGMNIDQRYNFSRAEKQREVDAILEKIHNKGINSLTKKERQILDEYSGG